jgi:nicotinate-nucleotide adenylyltransferase
MKLCVFQGTFDPIHNVHLAMANFVKNTYDFNNILFIPAYKPPHKEIDDTQSNHRLQMVKTAIEGETAFGISNIEFQNERYSYTYLTILELYKRYKIEGKIGFIIGSDSFREITEWYEADKLKKLVEFIVFPREQNLDMDRMMLLKHKGYNHVIAKSSVSDLSSTTIRERLNSGQSVAGLVPGKVLEYIRANGLYKE